MSAGRGVPVRPTAEGGVDAEVAAIRALLRAGTPAAAQAAAEEVRARADTPWTGDLLCGIVSFHRGYTDLAWSRLAGLPPDVWSRHAPGEFARSGLSCDPDRTLGRIRDLVRQRPPDLAADSWWALTGPVVALRETALARELVGLLRDAPTDDRAGVGAQVEALRPWLEVDPDDAVAPAADGPVVAVLDYRRPGTRHGSNNIGDPIQSVAALGHLVRHTGIAYTGDQELTRLFEGLQGRTRGDLARTDVTGTVEVVSVQRDASSFQSIPDGTWALCFGWFMHPVFGFRHDFPLNPAIRPIFVSFHCNERELLSEEAVDYLTRYGPVGCRDWTTVYLLRSMGVPAFFSGCLTTTISTLFPAAQEPPPPPGTVAYVDAPAPEGTAGDDEFGHALAEVRTRSFAANCSAAVARLELYRSHYRRVVTSRLHAYLPLRSLGVEVDFRPGNPSDVRFEGLGWVDDAAFARIRDGLLEMLEPVVRAILGGAGEDEVYRVWSQTTRAALADAEARCRPAPEPRPELGWLAPQLAEARGRALARPGTPPASRAPADCVVEVPRGDPTALLVLLRSLAAHATGPVRVWLLTDRRRPRVLDAVASACPGLELVMVPFAGVDPTGDGPVGRPGRLLTVVLPDLLPEVERAVLLPAGAVVESDVAELLGLDLAGHWFAAPTVQHRRRRSGFGVLHAAAARLRDQPQAAATLLRQAYARHRFDFDAFSADVMVLDLARMRADGAVASLLGACLSYGLDGRESLCFVAGPDRGVVPQRWAHVPTQDQVSDPALVHWGRDSRPWDETFAPEQDRWWRYARSVAEG